MRDEERRPEAHPIKKAAWQGYREYRKEMSDKSTLSGWRQLTLKSMIRIAAILVAVAILYDLLQRQ
jgi:hypothetical protein